MLSIFLSLRVPRCRLTNQSLAWLTAALVVGHLSISSVSVCGAQAEEPVEQESMDPADGEARRQFESGREAYDEARFEDALRNFQRAYELVPRPGLWFNIGLAHERLGDDELALEAFQSFLAELQDAPNRGEVQRRVEVLQRRLEGSAPEAVNEPSGPSPSQGSVAPWVMLVGGGALAVAGGVFLAIGVVDRGSVTGSENGELEWGEAASTLDRADAFLVLGSIGLGVGAALALTSIVVFGSDRETQVTGGIDGINLRGQW